MSRKSVINRPAPPRTVAGATLLRIDDSLVTADTSLSAFTVTLPDAVALDTNIIYIKAPSAGTNALTVNCLGIQTIDGSASVTLDQNNQFLIVHSDGSNWKIVSQEDAGAGGGGIVGVNLVTPTSTTSYSTIAAALAAASSGDAVVVGPGVYAESVTVPAGVTLSGTPFFTAALSGAASTGTRVTLNDGSSLIGFAVTAPTDATPAINYAGSTSAILSDCSITGNGGAGIGIRGASGTLRVFNTSYMGGAIDAFILIDGGTVVAEDIQVYSGSLGAIYQIESGTLTDAQTIQLTASLAAAGFLVNGGTVISEDARFLNVDDGLHITANGTAVNLRTPKFDANTWNLRVDPGVTTGSLFVVAAQGDRDLITAPPAYLSQGQIAISFQDEKLGDEAFLFFSEVAIGAPGNGRELSVGEGDSYTRGMVAFSATTPTSGFTDITSQLLLPDGTSVALLPGTSAGNTFYIGGDLPFVNIKVLITTAMSLGAGSVAVEHSDGAGGWIAFDTMSSTSSFPYTSYADAIFQRAQSEQVRFQDIVASFGSQAVNGVAKYWVRVRVVSAISTAPTADHAKLGPNRTELNPDGFVEYYGRAEPRRLLNWHRRLEDDLIGASPGNASLLLAQQISITPVDNLFQNNAIDGNGGLVPVPVGLDTSRSLIYRVGWTPRSNGAGDVELELRTAVVKEGDVLDGSIPRVLATDVAAVSAQNNVLFVTEFEFRIPQAVVGEFVALSFVRDATVGNPDDTYAGDIAIVFAEIEGIFWR